MSAPEKAEVVTKVSSSPLPKRKVLRELGIPKSTYYRWLRRQDQQGLEDRPGGDQPRWNRLTIQEECSVLLSAREMPELSRRQMAAWRKLERYHQTIKRDVNQVPYELPADLEAAIAAFVSYYNYRRYHKALGNVTPSDVLRGRREDILRRRREVKAQTIEQRRQHNKALRELTTPQSDP